MNRYVLFLLVLLCSPPDLVQCDMPSDTAAAVPVSVPDDNGQAVAVPVPSEKAMSYYNSGNILWIVNLLWGLLIPGIILFTGFSSRMRQWAEKIGKRWFFIIGLYFIIFSLITFVVDLPLTYYQEYVRQHAYDLSNQSFGKWAADAGKSLGVQLLIGFLFLWIPYLLLRKSPARWWLYVGILMVPFLFFIIIISPVWIDPLFNEFGPMKNAQLEQKILSLADRAGIDGGKVYEVNKSVDTKSINAYVTGFLDTKRIVLWDTIIGKLDEREILFVMGHEMGHYVLGHVWKTVMFLSVVIMLTLYFAHRIAGIVLSRWGTRFGCTALSDIASLPLIIILVNLSFFAVMPAVFAYSRAHEADADRFGLEITRDNHAAANAFVKLQQENLGNPRPGILYKLWRSSHPPLGERIDFCNSYKPWLHDRQGEYDHLFRR